MKVEWILSYIFKPQVLEHKTNINSFLLVQNNFFTLNMKFGEEIPTSSYHTQYGEYPGQISCM